MQNVIPIHDTVLVTGDLIATDTSGIYHSRVLPKFKIDARIFWQDPLPQGGEVAKLVEAMLNV